MYLEILDFLFYLAVNTLSLYETVVNVQIYKLKKEHSLSTVVVQCIRSTVFYCCFTEVI